MEEVTLDYITTGEWEILARDAEAMAFAYDRADDQATANRFRERVRAFKALAAQKSQEGDEYATAGTIRLYRSSVTLPEVEELLRAMAGDDELEGVTKLAANIVLNILAEVYADYTGEPVWSPEMENPPDE